MAAELGEDELLPEVSEAGVGVEFVEGADAEEGGGDAGVGEVDLGRLDEAFAEVGDEGGDGVRHEGSLEQVDVAADGVVGHAEGAAEAGVVGRLGRCGEIRRARAGRGAERPASRRGGTG